jgi:hypothetical protein
MSEIREKIFSMISKSFPIECNFESRVELIMVKLRRADDELLRVLCQKRILLANEAWGALATLEVGVPV